MLIILSLQVYDIVFNKLRMPFLLPTLTFPTSSPLTAFYLSSYQSGSILWLFFS